MAPHPGQGHPGNENGHPMRRGGPPAVDMNRDPVVAFWELTLACALGCRHCRAQAQPKRHPLELDTNECYRVLEDLASFDHKPIIVLSGSDPFMRRDLIERGKSLGLTMSVSPSATALVTRDRMRHLAELGVSRISLSLDGSNAKSHDSFRGFAGSFQRTIDAMDDAKSVGLEFQINTTVTRDTVDDVMSAEEHERVFNWICDISGDLPFMVKTTLGQPFRRVQVMRRLKAEGLTGPLDRERIKSMYLSIPTNDGKGIFFISHLGEVYPSGFMPISTGNVRKESPVDIYRNAELFKSLHDPSNLGGKCEVCPFNAICGGCRAREYGATGDPFSSEPFCVFQPAEAIA